ncbi:MAG: extensin family protein [Rhodobacteraceae bacterium]|nr:extensin family protein [Paracoccaceae bacterium]
MYVIMVMMVGGGAPLTSPRPAPRPGLSTSLPVTHPSARAQEAGLGVVLQNLFRATPRPPSVTLPGFDPALAIAMSPRPEPRPDEFVAQYVALTIPQRQESRRGSVCGNRQIRGTEIAAIPARLPGCGVAKPVRVTSVSGVRLSQEPTIDCDTARALNTWVREGVIPAVGRRGGGVAALKVIAHYSCRTRNSRPGAKISEHGKGHAIDVAAVVLKNGDVITVLEGWRDRRDSRVVRAMHSSACGPFGTVLGPEADRYHQDHLHVDTARYRSGSYCR